MLVARNQYVNIHAHREAQSSDEWLIKNIDIHRNFAEELAQEANYSIGLHPWKIEEVDIDACFDFIREARKNKHVIAIGECGLDKAIDIPLQKQMEVYERHFEIAEEAKLPVIIHSVRSTQELIQFNKVNPSLVPLIIHGFRGGIQEAGNLLKQGFYLSFGETVLFSDKVRHTVKALPLEKLFIETDDSEVSIVDLYIYIAEIRKITVAELQAHMIEKTNSLFNIGKS